MFDREQTLTLATSKDSLMVAFKDYILNYDRKLIQFDESDNISESKNPSKDLKWLDLNEAEDHFDEFLYPIAQEITRDFSESKDQSIVYDHHWLMHKVKRHIADFLGDSGGLDYRQLSLAILEFLIAGNQGILYK